MATILIVDDEPELVEVLRFSLERAGYHVAHADDGLRALELARRGPTPDLVLLDGMLPNLSGAEVCRRLRMEEATRCLPIIMVSARGEKVDRAVAYAVGVDDYVVKPFSVRALLERVRELLERQTSLTTDVCDVGRMRIDLGMHE